MFHQNFGINNIPKFLDRSVNTDTFKKFYVLKFQYDINNYFLFTDISVYQKFQYDTNVKWYSIWNYICSIVYWTTSNSITSINAIQKEASGARFMLSGLPGRLSIKISVCPLLSPWSQCFKHLYLIKKKRNLIKI